MPVASVAAKSVAVASVTAAAAADRCQQQKALPEAVVAAAARKDAAVHSSKAEDRQDLSLHCLSPHNLCHYLAMILVGHE